MTDHKEPAPTDRGTPAGFNAAPREVLGYAAWIGPCEGRVSTTWTPDHGLQIHVEEAEDLSRPEAEVLLAQLAKVLAQLTTGEQHR